MGTATVGGRTTDLRGNQPARPRTSQAPSRERPPAGPARGYGREVETVVPAQRGRSGGGGGRRGSGGRPKPRTRRPPEVLTDAEVRALLAACGDFGSVAARHKAMLALLYRAGLRISEALSLRPHDLDFEAGTVRVRFGKGGSDRVAGLDAGAAALVRQWLEKRRGWDLPPGAPLLCSSSGRMVTTAYVRRLMPRLARRAGSTGVSRPTGCGAPTRPSSGPRGWTWGSSASSSAIGAC